MMSAMGVLIVQLDQIRAATTSSTVAKKNHQHWEKAMSSRTRIASTTRQTNARMTSGISSRTSCTMPE